MKKCILCSDKAKKGSVYCTKCEIRVHVSGDIAPKGTFKKTVTGRAKVVRTAEA